MQPGEISEPIPSPLAVHIFRMNSHETPPMEKVRASIAQRMRQQTMFDRIEMLRRSAKVEFDPKYFPMPKIAIPPLAKRPS